VTAIAFDPSQPPESYFRDPTPFHRDLRVADPVHRCPDGSFYLTRHRDLVSVYRNPKVFSSDKRDVFHKPFGNSLLYEHHTTSLVFNDPPLHTQVRKAIGDALSPKAAIAMEGSLRTLVDRLLDRIEAAGHFDLVEDFAAAIPVEVISNLLRVPSDERGPLRRWSLAILGALEFQLTPQLFEAGNRAVGEFIHYLERFVEARRASLSDADDDLLARLIRHEDRGFRLSGRTLYHQIIFILNAGHETTTNLIGNGVLTLLRHPDQLARLRRDPARLDTGIEELLRFIAPIQLNNRMSRVDTDIAGVAIPKGANLTLCIAAANRDPDVFANPDHLDVARRPNPHLSFGSGIHTCAGAAIARLEGRVAVERIFARFPKLALAGTPSWAPRARFRVLGSAAMAVEA